MLLPRQTKFINCINVFWRDRVRAKSYEGTARRILQYGVCALNATRSDTRSKNIAALQIALNAEKNEPEGCLGHTECLPKPGRTGQDRTAMEFRKKTGVSVVRKQTCNNSSRLARKR